MTSATVTSKGQITIPARILEAMKAGAVGRIKFVQIEVGRHEIMAVTPSVTTLKGMFGKTVKNVFIEEMIVAIAVRGAAGQ